MFSFFCNIHAILLLLWYNVVKPLLPLVVVWFFLLCFLYPFFFLIKSLVIDKKNPYLNLIYKLPT